MKIITYTVAAFALISYVLIFSSCNRLGENSNSNTPPTTTPDKGTLYIEAQLVYDANEVRPVARKSLFLLNKDLLDVEVPSPKSVNARSMEDYTSKLSFPQNLKATIELAQANKKMRAAMERIGMEKNIKIPPERKLSDEEKKTSVLGIEMIIVMIQQGKDTAPHFLREVMTDFQGKVVINDIAPGDYWILGVTETKEDYAFWNYKVSVVAGDNRLLLDQNNALYFK